MEKNEIYHQNSLPVGTMVQEYRIIKILGIGNFGIVYSAENKYFSEIVALKEFLPSDLARRLEGESRVSPLSTETEKGYQWARHKFLQEAKTLRELGQPDQHPNIVRVRQFIEANDTAYMVMDFEKGVPLSKMLEQRETLPEKEIKGILYALLDGLERVHAASVWHRDIKPSNILIRPDGSPVLIDFGAARKDISGSDRSTMAIFSPAFAAPEQIYPGSDQGPWTDIYSMGATLYRAVTGALPANATKRWQGEAYLPATAAVQGHYSPSFLAAIDAALNLHPQDRPQSVSEWKALFAPKARLEDDKTVLYSTSKKIAKKKKTEKRTLFPVFSLVAVAMVALVTAGMLIYRWIDQPGEENQTYPISITETMQATELTDIQDSKIVSGDKQKVPLVPAHLIIHSVPAAAQVFLDGESKGVTPLDTIVAKGTHSLRLSLNGHYDWESSLLIEDEGDIPIRIPMLSK